MTPNEFVARQRAAETVARDAGRLARSYLDDASALEVTLKGPQDVVTAADGAVERMIVAGGRTEVGVIYDPNGDLLYSARRGAGAWRNAAPIRVSATEDLARATVDIGYSRRTEIPDFARIMTRLLERGVNVTQSHSAALGLARVADGRLDGYAERHLFAWDALAGLLLVEEAGGRVNAFLEGDALTAGNETIAATPALYAAIASALEVV